MAFSTKNWRRLVAEDRVFYWQAGSSDWWDNEIALFRARPELEPRRLLVVSLPAFEGRVERVLGWTTPRIVRGCIDTAIKCGWLETRPNLRQVLVSDSPPYTTLNPSWITSTVRSLAAGISGDKAFDRMPVLADALQDAGCDNEDILNHCRGPGPYTRGHHILNLILGK